MMDTRFSMKAPAPHRLLLAGLFLLLLCAPGRAADSLVISEFMANNAHTLADEDGDYSDWIEIYNAGTNTVDLLNWSLTDDASKLTKWRFPSTNLLSGKFLVVFASNKNRRTPGAPLHTNFKLDANGEYLALVQPDGVTIATQFTPTFPPQARIFPTAFPPPARAQCWCRPGRWLALSCRATARSAQTGHSPRSTIPAGSAGRPAWATSGWSGYESLLGLNLLSPAIPAALRIDSNGDGLSDNNSVFIRVPFVLSDPSPINSLTLRMRYDAASWLTSTASAWPVTTNPPSWIGILPPPPTTAT